MRWLTNWMLIICASSRSGTQHFFVDLQQASAMPCYLAFPYLVWCLRAISDMFCVNISFPHPSSGNNIIMSKPHQSVSLKFVRTKICLLCLCFCDEWNSTKRYSTTVQLWLVMSSIDISWNKMVGPYCNRKHSFVCHTGWAGWFTRLVYKLDFRFGKDALPSTCPLPRMITSHGQVRLDFRFGLLYCSGSIWDPSSGMPRLSLIFQSKYDQA